MDPDSTLPKPQRHNASSRRGALILLIVTWTLLYNLLIKRHGVVESFFGILDTISDDFVMGAILAIGLGALILVGFSITKLYTQLISNVYSFRILEDIVFSDVEAGRFRSSFSRLIHLQDEPCPGQSCPLRITFLLFSCGLIYVMSWVYVILFAEALFFVSWSAGVNLPTNDDTLLMLPTLALAIPFTARVMAYLRYPYAQDYADIMPAALFVLTIVAALGYEHKSPDQEFFLVRVYSNPQYLSTFVANGAFLAFIPVFFECVFWLFELGKLDEKQQDATSERVEERAPETLTAGQAEAEAPQA